MMKKHTRRQLAALGLAAAMGLSLTACGSQQPSQEEVEQAIEDGTLTIEDALGQGWIDQAWVDAYQEEHSVPAGSKMEANVVGDFTTTTLSDEEFTRDQLGAVVLFAFLDPDAEETQAFYDALAEGYDGVVENGADIVVCTKRESGNELFADAPFPVILYNDSLKAAIGTSSSMVEDAEMPNAASWYVNGSFLSAWYSTVEGEDLPASAASFVEMSRDPAFGAAGSPETGREAPQSSAGASSSGAGGGVSGTPSGGAGSAPVQGSASSSAAMAPMG